MPRPRRKRVPDVVRFREQQEQSATEFDTGEYVNVPVRSGRQAEHACLAGMGPAMRPNAGIRKGNARGTELGQADFRKATFVCGADGCNALVDLLWAWRVAGTRMPSVGDGCSACGSNRARKRNVDNQRKMAAAVESGARRLVHRERHLVVRSDYARTEAVRAAIAQADGIRQ